MHDHQGSSHFARPHTGEGIEPIDIAVARVGPHRKEKPIGHAMGPSRPWARAVAHVDDDVVGLELYLPYQSREPHVTNLAPTGS